MPKRISKKLMMGLGSTLTFGTVGIIGGFGVKSIIDATLSKNLINKFAINSPIESNLNNLPNYNTATKDMFIPTKNLKRFHFGNTQIGQKVTPWGWLGVFEDDNNVKTRIALTGWNGEIIWVNEDYKNSDSKLNVYDMQYDFNSNLIFVLRTDSSNGFYEGNSANDIFPEVYLEVLDAKTGIKYKDSVKSTEFRGLQINALNKLVNGGSDSLLNGYKNNENIRKKTKNLYYLDLTYSPEQKAIIATWMPNFMQMARQSKEESLPTFFDVIDSWDKVSTSFIFNTEKLNDENSKKKKTLKLINSPGISENKDSYGKTKYWIEEEGGKNNVDAEKIHLLTNPFFTTSSDGNAFVMHLIGARSDNGTIYHKTIGWKIVSSSTLREEAQIHNAYDSIQMLGKKAEHFNLEVKKDKSWTMAKGWEPSFINANLRVNKNMFDQNSIVFAYPYSSSSNVIDSRGQTYGAQNKAMPVFNVVQIWLDNDGKIKETKETTQKDNIDYNFGKQIDDYYNANKDNYLDPEITNNIYPYPTPDSFDVNEKNVNHSYNRLISVSPFDNTVIYAAKPNVRAGIFGPYTASNKDKWAGFWIANPWDLRNKKYYHPLIIANDPLIISSADKYDSAGMGKMLNNVNDLYTEGFAFDVASTFEPDTFRMSLNLYFNQTGSGFNSSYENKDPDFKTSKIGLIRDVLYDSGSYQEGMSGNKGWGTNVYTRFPGKWSESANEESPESLNNKKLFATTINNDSFSSLIHSRADLTKWYPRTWANANFPSNMLRKGEIFSYQAPWKFAVAEEFNKQLVDQDWVFSNKESIDLVSSWRDSGETNDLPKYRKRFDRLIIKRPTIITGSESLENGLKLLTKYELSSNIKQFILDKRGWKDTNVSIQNELTLTKNVDIKNTSIQILSSWKDALK